MYCNCRSKKHSEQTTSTKTTDTYLPYLPYQHWHLYWYVYNVFTYHLLKDLSHCYAELRLSSKRSRELPSYTTHHGTMAGRALNPPCPQYGVKQPDGRFLVISLQLTIEHPTVHILTPSILSLSSFQTQICSVSVSTVPPLIHRCSSVSPPLPPPHSTIRGCPFNRPPLNEPALALHHT